MYERGKKGFKYQSDVRNEISFPVGGIGAGSIGVSASGRLIDWEIFNRPGKRLANGISHFAIKAENNNTVLDARVLNGPYREGSVIGNIKHKQFGGYGHGVHASALAGIPHFKKNTFEAIFPKATLNFEDDTFPGNVQLEMFSSFIPHNSKDSSLPAALFVINVENNTNEELHYHINAVLGNPDELNGEHEFEKTDEYSILTLKQRSNKNPYGKGEVSLGCDADDISCQRYCYRGSWFDPLTIYWQDFRKLGHLQDRYYDSYKDNLNGLALSDHGALSARITLKPNEKKKVRFVISWYYPVQEIYWRTVPKPYTKYIHNFYGKQWDDSKSVQSFVFQNWHHLQTSTEEFCSVFYNSSLPNAVVDAVTANLALLVSPVIMRLEDGTLWGWEGSHDDFGSCEGTCTHVWNYQQALPFLFPDLERSIRNADFKFNQKPDGGMSFRQILPLGSAFFEISPCVDGQFGGIIKTYREWKLCGDNEWLASVWSSLKKSMEYAWSDKNQDKWDTKKTGIIWGRQHHTLDMELYSPNSWLSSMYLAALKASAEMALVMGDVTFSRECQAIYEKGVIWFENNLFNGEYFNQDIDIKDTSYIHSFSHLSNEILNGLTGEMISNDIVDIYWSDEHKELNYQIGNGCSVDQLLGQWLAYVSGLGDIVDQALVDTAILNIFKNNYKEELWNHINPCRTYGMEDEGGLVLVTWPKGDAPAIPVPYSEEVWTGTEYAVASQLLYRGFKKEALQIIETARRRYNGNFRNPWSEIECGSNYVRSLSSFSLVTAWTGQCIDAVNNSITFNPIEDTMIIPWFSGCAWGTLHLKKHSIDFKVVSGEYTLAQFNVKGRDILKASLNQQEHRFRVEEKYIVFEFPIHLKEGDILLFESMQ